MIKKLIPQNFSHFSVFPLQLCVFYSRRLQWMHVCGRNDLVGKTAEELKSYKVCGMHFEYDLYSDNYLSRLKRTAVPSIFPINKAETVDVPETNSTVNCESKANETVPMDNASSLQPLSQVVNVFHLPLSSVQIKKPDENSVDVTSVQYNESLPFGIVQFGKIELNRLEDFSESDLDCPQKRKKYWYMSKAEIFSCKSIEKRLRAQIKEKNAEIKMLRRFIPDNLLEGLK